MTSLMQSPQAPRRNSRMILDCRELNFSATTTGSLADSVLAWVTSFPEPSSMHVVLPSSVPNARRLQCTLQGMGCGVTRVSFLPSARL